jgi:Aerotolerance regulator N-terminal/von Willebrand factor type A domain
MSFLSPLFFLGLGAIVVPVLVHLIQRERKRVVEFPSLMFIQKIPYQSVRRRRIRHWFLLLMRAAAIALFVAAFARPFFPGGVAAIAAAGGNRELVILLDNSASMGYGDRWQRAVDAARSAANSMTTGDRATLVLFGRNAEENIRATSDRGRIEAAIAAAKVTSGATRYGPALKLAESILSQSTHPRREAILISDFQKSGWSGAEDIRFGENMTLTPVSVTEGETTNVSIPSVTFGRAEFSGQERITVTAGIMNRNAAAARVPVALEIEGRTLETIDANIGPNASASVSFAPFTLAEPTVRGTVKSGSDPLAADNAFHFVLSPARPISVLIIDSADSSDSSFYLARALAIGKAPAFNVEISPAPRVSSGTLDTRNVVILNDAVVPLGLPGEVLRRFVERGGGLLVALGQRSVWPTTETNLLPGKLGPVVDRSSGRGATVGWRDHSHQVFEIFRAPRSGDFTAARVYRYRTLETAPGDRVLARFDDGAVAAAERRVGNGRVIAWATTLDREWSDLPQTPVFLPLVHQFVKYLAQYERTTEWATVGQVVDLSAMLKNRADRIVMTPAGDRVNVAASEAGVLELNEAGVYEVRAAAAATGRADRIAVNLDPAESDLAVIDPQELVAAVTGRAAMPASTQQAAAEVAPADAEKQQGLWWYLLLAGMLLLAAETVIANRLSRNERFT